MLAAYHLKFGGPKVTIVGELPRPKAEDLKPGELLIKVLGASLNPADIGQRQGGLRPILKVKPPVVFGFDFSGVVEASQDAAFKQGDEVFGMVKGLRRGTLAQYLIVDADICAKKPSNLSDEEAASIPLVGITAVKAFRLCGMVEYAQPSELRVLILGGAGGVGSCAIQLAKGLYNATFVATTASPGKKSDLVKSLGADVVANHREKEIASQLQAHGPFDVILDCVGDVKRAVPLIKKGGSVASIAYAPTVEGVQEFLQSAGNGVQALYGVRSILSTSLGTAVVNLALGATSMRRTLKKRGAKYYTLIGTGSSEITEILCKEIEEGRLKPVIDKTFTLTNALEAIAYLEEGHAAGKVVVTVQHDE